MDNRCPDCGRFANHFNPVWGLTQWSGFDREVCDDCLRRMTKDWRRIAPADCVGMPAISSQYQNELIRLAQERGMTLGAGMTLTARYERINGEWFPIADSIAVGASTRREE